MKINPIIGVFDSGRGGLSVANAIKKAIPDSRVLYEYDADTLTYGDKNNEDLYRLSKPWIERLVRQKCDVIVIACNTVTTTIISRLRGEIEAPLVGIEPMVKPAALTSKSKIIAVCATPTTLKSQRYRFLKEQYARGVEVLEPDCSDWAFMIEKNEINYRKIYKQIDSLCRYGADKIVLGCTHYHWIAEVVAKVANGRAGVLYPEDAAIAQLKRVLKRLS